MNIYSVISIVTCIGHLALATLSAMRSSRSPLAPILAALCFVMFSWNFATLLYHLTGHSEWRFLDACISPWTTPVAFHFIITFVGKGRRHRWLLRSIYLVFIGLSMTSASAFFTPWAAEFPGSATWALIHMICTIMPIGISVMLLMRHLRHQVNAQEQMRTRLVFSSLLIGIILASTELWADIGIPIPRLGPSATLVIAILLAVVTLRYRLFEHELSLLTTIYSLAVSFVAVLGGLSLLRYLQANTAVIIMAAIITALLLVPMIQRAVVTTATQRGQVERLAVMGKLSEQMAHDLKNPLAALKGAVQFLQEERTQGRSIDHQGEFLNLLGNEIDRLNRLTDKYLRLGKIEPTLLPTDTNRLIREVFALERFGFQDKVGVKYELAQELPLLMIDPDLVATALENIISNSLDAMPQGGLITVKSSLEDSLSDQSGLVITVSDTGIGMNARQVEQAFDELFTTKATGSGLGLALVRQVVEAHDGTVSLSSQEGKGSSVSLHFPFK